MSPRRGHWPNSQRLSGEGGEIDASGDFTRDLNAFHVGSRDMGVMGR